VDRDAEWEILKQAVWQANCRLPELGLVHLTWGNVSARDAAGTHFVIKPSGVPYPALRPEDMVVVRMADGAVVDGRLRPSSDTPAHRALYRRRPAVAAVVHTHSRWATSWAQAGRPIPVLGTTHADFAAGPVPVTRALTADDIAGDFEERTGETVADTITDADDPYRCPAALVRGHGVFAWGRSPDEAVEHALICELVAEMAYRTLQLNPEAALPPPVARRHYRRKHGRDAYYGQSRPTS
jgi:L-ribulose-5-phosphate 4-epimerase